MSSQVPDRKQRQRPAASSKSESGAIDLAYAKILWRRRYLILAVTFVAALIGVFQVNRSTTFFTSEAEFKYEPASAQIIDFGERSSVMYLRDEIRTAVQLIQTPEIASAVLRELGGKEALTPPVEDTSPFTKIKEITRSTMRWFRNLIVTQSPSVVDSERLEKQNAAQGLLTSVDVAQRPDTKLIRIRVTRTNAMEAMRICDEFCRQFILSIQEEKRLTFSYARDYLEQQIDDTKTRLEASEKELYRYSGQTDMRLMSESRNIAIEMMMSLTRKIEEEKINIAILEAEYENAQDRAQSKMVLENDPIVSELLRRRSTLLIEKASLEAENQEDFAPLTKVNNEIAAIDRQVELATEDFSEAYIGTKKSELDAAKTKLANLEGRLVEQNKNLDGLEERMISLRVLQREVDATREIFNTLLDQYNRLEVAEDATATNVRVVRPASIPTVPSAPNVTRILGLSLIGGFMLGCALALGMSLLDRSVRDPQMVEEQLKLPSLGMVPNLQRTTANPLARSRLQPAELIAPFAESKQHLGAEAFRFLRTSIEYSSSERSRVLLITSSRAEEGKSTVSANLGIFYAEQNRPTLIIDADFRRPRLQRFFSLARVPGLSDVLTGKADLQEAVQHTGVENLDLLPAGFSTPSPITLLESQAMTDLLAVLRERYSQVIIDTCPADGMADPFVLSTRVDGVIVVVRRGVTPFDALARVADKLRSFGANIIGVIYNNTDTDADTPAYNYVYGQGRRGGGSRVKNEAENESKKAKT